MIVRAYAKLNLSLAVGPLSSDGYHPIASIFQEISLFDTLTIHHIPEEEGLQLRATDIGLPTDGRNTIVRAFELIRNKIDGGLSVQLFKRIPMGGGLGGGSANAAAFLVGVNQLLDLGFSDQELEALGAKVGSDVPFFIRGGRQWAKGRGEQLTPMKGRSPFGAFVILMPGFEVSTPFAYRAFDAWPNQSFDEEAVKKKGWGDNHLKDPVFDAFPELKAIEKTVAEAGYSLLMTGSGSTVFLPFATIAQATDAREKLAQVLPTIQMEVVTPISAKDRHVIQ